jgi:hypothetical protein
MRQLECHAGHDPVFRLGIIDAVRGKGAKGQCDHGVQAGKSRQVTRAGGCGGFAHAWQTGALKGG